MIAYTVNCMPKWNPINVCSYHLQEAGATPVQEVAYALCTAMTVLDAVVGQVGIITLGDRDKRNAIGAEMASQPIAAQVYERVQGLRRQAYDSSDYLEGLEAFGQKRQPIFRGT